MTQAPGPSRDDHDPAQDAPAAPDHLDELESAGLAARLRASGELTAASWRRCTGWTAGGPTPTTLPMTTPGVATRIRERPRQGLT